MKKLLKALLLVALFTMISLPSWAQSSTQGKEFWVALIPSKGPDSSDPTNTGQFQPYIAISASKACQVTISNPNTTWSETIQIPANSPWVERQIPLAQWYQNTIPTSETIYNNGIKIESTEMVSVYSCLRWGKSMDATNVLPINALQSEYVVLTYSPSAKDGDHHNTFTVLAAEDCTVTITPSVPTDKGKPANVPFDVNMKKGQVYHIVSATDQSISGTTVRAKNDKKIAIFSGCILGNIPTTVADRDLLYEQLFPINYWGTDFVVTRSLEKDANRVQIIALMDGTDVTINGSYQASSTSATIIPNGSYSFTLNAGETYEYELSEGYADGKWDNSKRATLTGINVVDKSSYIHTSCPAAVLSFDVGNSYKCKTGSEMPSDDGAPAMTWVSPIQQMMKEVVFGVMGTNNTHNHFVNIIVPTNHVSSAKLGNASIADRFIPVESNPTYSYARIKLATTTTGQTNPTYHLQCKGGFIATVYGNGSDESYAYSVGSSAVEQGVDVNGVTFTDGFRSEEKFCFGDSVEFDAKGGTDEITRVDWYFGDGTTEAYGPAQTKHAYTSPGWYDVTANLYGHQVCTDESEMFLGQVSFSFLVYRPDTLIEVQPTDACIKLEDYKANPAYYDDLIANGEIDTIQENCYDDVVLRYITYSAEKEEFLPDLTGQDLVQGHNGKWYDKSQDVIDTIPEKKSPTGCKIYQKYHVEVITCLDLDVPNNAAAQHVCPGQTYKIDYKKKKGNIDGDAIFRVPGYPDQTIVLDDNVDDGSFTLPISDITKPGYYSGKLLVNDKYCPDRNPKEYPIDFAVYHPDSIFKFKFNNVLAVYKPGHGGNSGYEFSNYEWHLIRGVQDTVMAAGPEASILYLGQGVTFESGDVVYIVLTDKDGMTLPSCPQVITNVKDFNPQQQNAPARKQLIDSRIVIKKGEQSYNIYGQRIQ